MSFLSHPRTLPFLVAGAFFMELLDGTVIATALPQMASSFGVRPVDLGIGMSAYLLTLAVVLPASGFVAERFGNRIVFCAAISIFTLASVACGLSGGFWSFTAARVVQGVGGALMVPVGRLAVLRATEKKDLVRAIATLTWPALTAPILAPPLGGFITHYASWRWIFFINVPIGLFGAWLAWRVVPDLQGDRRRAFDSPGFVLAGVCGLCFMGGTDLIGRETIDWPAATGLLAASAVLAILTVRHVRRHPVPILDLDGLRFPSFAVSVAGGSLYRMAVSAVPFLLPLMFQVGFGLDPFRSGLLVLSLFLGNMAIKPLTTPVLRRFGFRATMVANGLLLAGSILACGFLTADAPVPLTVTVLFLGGVFRSMGLTAINTIAFADIPESGMSGANTLFNMLQQMSLGLGVAIGALALRVAQVWRPAGAVHATPAEFSIAFAIISLVALAAIVDVLQLPAEAGAHVARG